LAKHAVSVVSTSAQSVSHLTEAFMKSVNQACTTACPLADLRALRDASAVLKKVPSPMRKFGTLYKKRNRYHFGDTEKMI
jgi:hypothetical protein